MLIEIAILIFSLIILAKSSTITIDKAIRLSKLTGMSSAVVGFVFIAFATSLPELTIAVISSIKGEGVLSLGNVIGANITNLTLIFGLVAISGATITKEEINETSKAVIFTSIIALFLVFLGYSDVSFGIFLFIIFFVFFEALLHRNIEIKNHDGGLKILEIVKSVSWLLVSVFVVVISAHFVTDYSIVIAKTFKISEFIIGATIVSLGTTLPELSIAIAAIKKKNIDLAIGDTVGSIVANLTLVFGVASIIKPIVISGFEPLLILFIISNLLFLFLISKKKINIGDGIALILFYLLFILVSIIL